jgi:hypothetical protein
VAVVAAASGQLIDQSIKSANVKRATMQSKIPLSIDQVKAPNLESIDYAHIW